MTSQRDGTDTPGEDCDVRRRKAIQAWQWGKDMGYPYVRPGLEDQSRWQTVPG